MNLSRIVRAAGCWGVQRLICCGNAKVIAKIARAPAGDDDAGPTTVAVEVHRTLRPILLRLREEAGYALVGLEQTGDAVSIFDFAFPRRCALVVGNERTGIEPETLRILDAAVEIPVYGMPLAHNVATATAMALYEYCRQYPQG